MKAAQSAINAFGQTELETLLNEGEVTLNLKKVAIRVSMMNSTSASIQDDTLIDKGFFRIERHKLSLLQDLASSICSQQDRLAQH